VTPQGEKPPNLADANFPNLGSKRVNRVQQYSKEIEALQQNMKEGDTYTFAFWGVSRFLDLIKWKVVGIPVCTPIDFSTFAGKPPLRVVFYSMPRLDEHDKRHLQSRKNYYLNAALWSSLNRPEPRHVEALTGVAIQGVHEGSAVTRHRSPRRRFLSFWTRQIAEPTEIFFRRRIVDPWKQHVEEPWRHSVAEPTEDFFQRSIAEPWRQHIEAPWRHSVAEPTEHFFKHSIAEPTENFVKQKIVEPTEQLLRDMQATSAEPACVIRARR
jgi:hypothetical protein